MGLIFYPFSKRFVDQVDGALLEGLSSELKITGVFVNVSQDIILENVKQYHLKAVQLHGEESPDYCRSLHIMLSKVSPGIELIKAFGIDERFDFKTLKEYNEVVDYFLFDTKTPAHGGSGIKFNWTTLENYDLDKEYFLSGGIGLDDLKAINRLDDQRLYAVDLNSKFETSPGLKDIEQVRRATDILRSPAKGRTTVN